MLARRELCGSDSSLRYTRVSVTSTVFTLRWSAAATSLFERPCGDELGDPLLAVGELVRITDAASRDPPELAAADLHPERGTARLKARQRLGEGLPRLHPLSGSAAGSPQLEVRPGELERVAEPLPDLEGLLQCFRGGVDVALRGEKLAAAARRRRQRPGIRGRGRALVEPRHERGCFVESTEADERLSEIVVEVAASSARCTRLRSRPRRRARGTRPPARDRPARARETRARRGAEGGCDGCSCSRRQRALRAQEPAPPRSRLGARPRMPWGRGGRHGSRRGPFARPARLRSRPARAASCQSPARHSSSARNRRTSGRAWTRDCCSSSWYSSPDRLRASANSSAVARSDDEATVVRTTFDRLLEPVGVAKLVQGVDALEKIAAKPEAEKLLVSGHHAQRVCERTGLSELLGEAKRLAGMTRPCREIATDRCLGDHVRLDGLALAEALRLRERTIEPAARCLVAHRFDGEHCEGHRSLVASARGGMEALGELAEVRHVTRVEVVLGREHAAAPGVVGLVRRGRSPRLLAERGGGLGGPSKPCPMSGVLERESETGVVPLAGECEMANPLVGLRDDLGEPAMALAPSLGPRLGVHRRAGQGVSEPDSVVLQARAFPCRAPARAESSHPARAPSRAGRAWVSRARPP